MPLPARSTMFGTARRKRRRESNKENEADVAEERESFFYNYKKN